MNLNTAYQDVMTAMNIGAVPVAIFFVFAALLDSQRQVRECARELEETRRIIRRTAEIEAEIERRWPGRPAPEPEVLRAMYDRSGPRPG